MKLKEPKSTRKPWNGFTPEQLHNGKIACQRWIRYVAEETKEIFSLIWLWIKEKSQDMQSCHRLGGILLLLSPFLLTFCTQLITIQAWGKTFGWIVTHLPFFFLTSGLFFLIELAVLLVIGRPFWAVLLPAVPAGVLAVVSTVKELVNGIPLLISDLSMATQAGNIAGFLRPGMSWGKCTGAALLLLAILLTALAFLYRGFSLPTERLRIAGGEIVVTFLVLAAVALPFRSVAAGEEGETQAERNDRLGFLLGMYSAGVDSAMSRPGNYTKDNLNRILLELEENAETVPDSSVQPNVVLLISESFFDINRLPGLTFDRDPVLNFRAIAKSWDTGSFLSNTYGGGTGNVEMEIFTGIPSAFLGAGESITTLSEPGIYARIPSVVKAFAQQGYETVMVHTYDDSLYNRGENLPEIGFETTIYQEDFPEGSHEAGGFLSDHSMTEELIRQFEAKDGSIFLYGLTMENHPPYHKDKFFGEPSFLGTQCADLNEEELGVVDSLAHGLRDADKALGELLDYFDQQEEPVIVVFLGDHLPSLFVDEENNLYGTLGYVSSGKTADWDSEEMKKMHTTDFLVWNNYDAELDVPEALSCTNLGAKLLSWAGLERPLYFQWVDKASQKVLLYRPRLFVTGDGEVYDKPPEEYESVVEDWRNLVYDILYGNRYTDTRLTELPR